MDRTRVDQAVGVLVAGILVAGLVVTWQTYRARQAVDEAHLSHMDAAGWGVHPIWYLLGSILVASVVAGLYLLGRDKLGGVREGSSPDGDTTAEPTSETPDELTPDPGEAPAAVDSEGDRPERATLDILPEDERRILEPVIDSPGLTQIELRDRSAFSKSKVSQTVSELEKRGLLYREPQGRTYRVYPDNQFVSDE